MEAVGVIPARYGSRRFKAKVLADLLGKPMIQHVWERAKKAKLLDDLIVACDDERIEEAVKNFGGKCILTAKQHPSGSDRIIEIVNPMEVKIVINIQADEPLIEPVMIDELVQTLLEDSTINMATLVRRIEDKEEISDPQVVKVVMDKNGYALYFSRAPIPYIANRETETKGIYYKHIGLYAYTKDFLFEFKNLPISDLESIERLEQLRALEHGYRIKVIETEFDTVGVDTSEDLDKVREILKSRSPSD